MGIDLVLRASFIWNGEVMEDRVLDRPQPVTLGATGKPMFVTPDLGLPDEFAIVRPGEKGYLLVLGERMRGVVSLGGQQHDVTALVAGEPFKAHPIQIGDWGVIELDDSCKLFFQFVPREEHAVILTRKQLHIGSIGFGVFSLAGAAIFAAKGVDFGEALFRAIALTALIFAGAAVARAVMKQNGESQASLAFSIILHVAILSFTFHVYAQQTAFALPEDRALAAPYIVTRAEPTPVLAKLTTTVPSLGPLAGAPEPAAPTIEVPAAPPTGNNGGAGARRPSRERGGAPPSEFGMLGNPDLQAILKKNVGGDVGRLTGITGNGPNRGEDGPPGPPRVTRGNDPKAPAGVHQPGREIAPITVRKGTVCIGACGSGEPVEVLPPPVEPGDEPTITAREIEEVVKRRAGIFRACYQREVNKLPELAGSVVMKWRITPAGKVINAKRSGGTLANQAVIDCITLNVSLLEFPAKGGASVTYPFVFSLGS